MVAPSDQRKRCFSRGWKSDNAASAAVTSKASFVDGDSLPKHGEKPEAWKSSGKRVKRGLFRSANNLYINADCNGAANIIRKVAATFGLTLEGVSRGALITPLRVRLWPTQESPSL